MTETDHDLAPTITDLPGEMGAEFLATGDPAEVIPTPQMLRMSPFFEALANHFNLHAEGDRMRCLNVPIEVIETLYAERMRVENAHSAGGAPSVS